MAVMNRANKILAYFLAISELLFEIAKKASEIASSVQNTNPKT